MRTYHAKLSLTCRLACPSLGPSPTSFQKQSACYFQAKSMQALVSGNICFNGARAGTLPVVTVTLAVGLEIWRPLKPKGELERGAATLVQADPLTRPVLQRWQRLVLNTKGVAAVAALAPCPPLGGVPSCIECDQHSAARYAEPDRAPDWPPRIRWPSRQARSACPLHFCLALSHGTQHLQHTN